MEPFMIQRRFCGPPNSGNGGYVCGLLARHIDGPAEVMLRRPPPLETPLEIKKASDGTVELCDREVVVADAKNAEVNIAAPPFVPFEAAEIAAKNPVISPEEHLLPMCFVCGPDRRPGDGMRLFAGAVGQEENLFAVAWQPDRSLAEDGNKIGDEFLWSALDCPTGYAAGADYLKPILLGKMIVSVNEAPKIHSPCIVTASIAERSGRKTVVNGAIYNSDGDLLALAQNTWITVSRSVQLGDA